MQKEKLELEIKKLIIDSLDLEDVSVEDIDSGEPLFIEGLGLDSIDALELGIALKKKYKLNLQKDVSNNKEHFRSVGSLAEFVIQNTK